MAHKQTLRRTLYSVQCTVELYSTTVQYDYTVQLYSVVGELSIQLPVLYRGCCQVSCLCWTGIYLPGLIQGLCLVPGDLPEDQLISVQCSVYTVQYDCTVCQTKLRVRCKQTCMGLDLNVKNYQYLRKQKQKQLKIHSSYRNG